MPLGRQHDRATFTCGEESLDRYLREQAGQDERRGLARPFVLVGAGEAEQAEKVPIVAYYTLSSHAVLRRDFAASDVRGVIYDHVPAILLGRLAVSSAKQGQGLGGVVLAAAVEHAGVLAAQLGVRVVVVDALHERAAAFYQHHGFTPFEDQPLRLFLKLAHLRSGLAGRLGRV